MSISAVDLFSIGIGPSSSHTVGPMRAALAFSRNNPHAQQDTIHITLHGSLAATGIGHGTDRAAILGLAGFDPTTATATTAPAFGSPIPISGNVSGPLGEWRYHLHFDPQALSRHPNAITFCAYDEAGNITVAPEVFFSVGGGFILSEQELIEQEKDVLGAGVSTTGRTEQLPYPFHNAQQLLEQCTKNNVSIPDLMLANEQAIHGSKSVVLDHLDLVWATMRSCVTAGIQTNGVLPGGLSVERRAPQVYKYVNSTAVDRTKDALWAMEWVNLYALAVNEENAAGGRIVTAPTNGAAGIIPAVLHYARDFLEGYDAQRHRDFLLAAAAVGIIIKENASISGAEVGCQGEVGSASAMAAAGLCQIMGGTPQQVEHAAEVALEHNLGLTCDPVGGLVQIPCIERNAIGAVKSINAARMSQLSTGQHRVSLDHVVKTMADTGRDMLTKYKETSAGGLAINLGLPVNLTEC
ncbi:L-serine ammonia-lyase [Corynebacterium sp. sy039]|uniref:L-serine ammonia-lyase n=1 Tax=Corynebacterium sp. sy039 TaxID=2599641 RepID=UPI0011B7AF4A|nr:L-serine ammonia-lyase [Corynebacterium sp. sy039]QDZ42690.1 L-serine ammonia-lyase [Corynebacterium sp. sy039]